MKRIVRSFVHIGLVLPLMAVLVLVGAGPALAAGQQIANGGHPGSAGLPYCLDVHSETAGAARTNIQVFGCRRSGDSLVSWQQWTKYRTSSQPAGHFKLRNVKTGKCLTYTPFAEGDGAANPIWAEANCNKGGQGFYTEGSNVNAGYLRFVAAESGWKCLSRVGGHPFNGQGVGLSYCPEDPSDFTVDRSWKWDSF